MTILTAVVLFACWWTFWDKNNLILNEQDKWMSELGTNMSNARPVMCRAGTYQLVSLDDNYEEYMAQVAKMPVLEARFMRRAIENMTISPPLDPSGMWKIESRHIWRILGHEAEMNAAVLYFMLDQKEVLQFKTPFGKETVHLACTSPKYDLVECTLRDMDFKHIKYKLSFQFYERGMLYTMHHKLSMINTTKYYHKLESDGQNESGNCHTNWNTCPHQNFSTKHYCPSCKDADDVFRFNHKTVWAPNEDYSVDVLPARNTVLMGGKPYYHYHYYQGRCHNIPPGGVITCDKETRQCHSHGHFCMITHDAKTGEMLGNGGDDGIVCWADSSLENVFSHLHKDSFWLNG